MRKVNSSWRICIDYIALNYETVKDKNGGISAAGESSRSKEEDNVYEGILAYYYRNYAYANYDLFVS